MPDLVKRCSWCNRPVWHKDYASEAEKAKEEAAGITYAHAICADISSPARGIYVGKGETFQIQ